MFDTHCHLNFKAFKKILLEVIQGAKDEGVNHIVIPGTDVPTSQRSVEIAQEYEGIYSATGIHPHHVYKYIAIAENGGEDMLKLVEEDLVEIEKLLQEKKVVAVGEIGMDRHVYEDTKYEAYDVKEEFIELQQILFKKQIKLALKYQKSVIIHNREAKKDVLYILNEIWDSKLEYSTVFHCCEPDDELLTFAKEHKMFVGVDGDITYYPEKQEFIKTVPLEMLVLETDSPFLLPEPLKSEKKYPNKPQNIKLVAEYIAKLRGISAEEIITKTTENGKRLFGV